MNPKKSFSAFMAETFFPKKYEWAAADKLAFFVIRELRNYQALSLHLITTEKLLLEKYKALRRIGVTIP